MNHSHRSCDHIAGSEDTFHGGHMVIVYKQQTSCISLQMVGRQQQFVLWPLRNGNHNRVCRDQLLRFLVSDHLAAIIQNGRPEYRPLRFNADNLLAVNELRTIEGRIAHFMG